MGDTGADRKPVIWRKQFLSDAGLKLSFNLADRVAFTLYNGRVLRASKGSVCGVLTKNYWVNLTGSIKRIGVQFHPGSAYPFFPFSIKTLTDGVFGLEEIWGKAGRLLTEAIQRPGLTTPERIELIETFLLQRVEQFEKHDFPFDRTAQVIRAKQGQVSIERLASDIELSLRQLERKFHQKSGISPKHLCRILRFRYLFEHITAHPHDKWVDTALSCGYYDQAHLINDFKLFTGMSPATFIREIVNQDLFINWGYDMEALANFGMSIAARSNSAEKISRDVP